MTVNIREVLAYFDGWLSTKANIDFLEQQFPRMGAQFFKSGMLLEVLSNRDCLLTESKTLFAQKGQTEADTDYWGRVFAICFIESLHKSHLSANDKDGMNTIGIKSQEFSAEYLAEFSEFMRRIRVPIFNQADINFSGRGGELTTTWKKGDDVIVKATRFDVKQGKEVEEEMTSSNKRVYCAEGQHLWLWQVIAERIDTTLAKKAKDASRTAA